jgi:hypothetical protein
MSRGDRKLRRLVVNYLTFERRCDIIGQKGYAPH